MDWQTFYAKYNILIWGVIFFTISAWVLISYLKNVTKIKQMLEKEQDRLRKKDCEDSEPTDFPSEKSP